MRQTLVAEPLATQRLDLLPLHADHAEEMAGALADPALHVFIGGEPAGPDVLRDRYLRMTDGSPDPDVAWLNWVLRCRDEGCLTGTVQATVTGGSEAELAWVVGTPWQGRGYAVEAVRGLVDWLRERSVTTLVAHVHPDHGASAAVAAAAGLTPTAETQDGEVRWRRSLAG